MIVGDMVYGAEHGTFLLIPCTFSTVSISYDNIDSAGYK